jgi:mannose-6-phosphate isomerase
MLSVQVHPPDGQAGLPPGESGKTEAWVVLDAAPESRIYAGLRPGTTRDGLREAIRTGTVADCLEHFTPVPGDAVFLPAGTVHALGGNLLVFEIQQNSDVTYRLYDWNHVDPGSGQPRPLHVEQALACVNYAEERSPLAVSGVVGSSVEQVIACLDFSSTTVGLVVPEKVSGCVDPGVPGLGLGSSRAGLALPGALDPPPVERERLFHCPYFHVWRLRGQSPFGVGAAGFLRILACIKGRGEVEHLGSLHEMETGDVLLLPAAVGVCLFRPHEGVTLLEIGLQG